MQITQVPINELTPYDKNPRINDAAVGPTAESIREFGFKVPIVIDKDGVIIAGHTRLKAAKKLGLERVPCIIADDLTPDQVKAFRLADNKVSELADWDFEMLDAEIADVQNIDMAAFGFDMDPEPEDLTDDGDKIEDIEETAEQRVSTGDIWQLGSHKLICGDSTKPETFNKLLDGEPVDLVVTDPPYGVDYSGAAKQDREKIKNDNLDDDKLYAFLIKAFKNVEDVLIPGGAIYVWHPILRRIVFESAFKDAGFYLSQILVWVKHHIVLNWNDYKNQYEVCLYGWKAGATHYFVEKFDQSTVINDVEKIDSMTKDELIKCLKGVLDNSQNDCIFENAPEKSKLHPTMKPVEIFARHILNSSKPGDVVLDPFAGSGTTIMACEQCNRQARVIELDPHYCDVIISRWEDFTGEKAVKME